jgi:hypothetical protein
MGLIEDKTITYAKAGGPPSDYKMLVVVDDVTNQIVPNAVEVNTKEGWVVVRIPSITKKNGSGPEWVNEKRFGSYIICRQVLNT